MPADKGIKVIELLQHAQIANWDYTDSSAPRKFLVGATVEAEYRAVKPSQLKLPEVEPTGRSRKGQTLLLGND